MPTPHRSSLSQSSRSSENCARHWCARIGSEGPEARTSRCTRAGAQEPHARGRAGRWQMAAQRLQGTRAHRHRAPRAAVRVRARVTLARTRTPIPRDGARNIAGHLSFAAARVPPQPKPPAPLAHGRGPRCTHSRGAHTPQCVHRTPFRVAQAHPLARVSAVAIEWNDYSFLYNSEWNAFVT